MWIIEWAMKTPGNLMILMGVLIPLFTAIGGLIKWLWDLKISKNQDFKKENARLLQQKKGLEEKIISLESIIQRYKENESIENALSKTDSRDCLKWITKDVFICPQCWYSKKIISVVNDKNETGYYKCCTCEHEGIFNKKVVQDNQQAMLDSINSFYV